MQHFPVDINDVAERRRFFTVGYMGKHLPAVVIRKKISLQTSSKPINDRSLCLFWGDVTNISAKIRVYCYIEWTVCIFFHNKQTKDCPDSYNHMKHIVLHSKPSLKQFSPFSDNICDILRLLVSGICDVFQLHLKTWRIIYSDCKSGRFKVIFQ